MINHDFDSSILNNVDHRPWPLPERPWVMTQTWNDVLMAHWPIPRADVRCRVPWTFDLDLFDGMAWVSVVAFHMTNVAPRGIPSIPGLSAFPELNVRTYVRLDDQPGVYFFSLDATSRWAVGAARRLLNLPYHTALITLVQSRSSVRYESVRRSAPEAAFKAVYGPLGAAAPARPGTLGHFLTERYCLYNQYSDGRSYKLDIHHRPWPLHGALADVRVNSMLQVNGIAAEESPARLHFAFRQDVVTWAPVPLPAPVTEHLPQQGQLLAID